MGVTVNHQTINALATPTPSGQHVAGTVFKGFTGPYCPFFQKYVLESERR